MLLAAVTSLNISLGKMLGGCESAFTSNSKLFDMNAPVSQAHLLTHKCRVYILPDNLLILMYTQQGTIR